MEAEILNTDSLETIYVPGIQFSYIKYDVIGTFSGTTQIFKIQWLKTHGYIFYKSFFQIPRISRSSENYFLVSLPTLTPGKTLCTPGVLCTLFEDLWTCRPGLGTKEIYKILFPFHLLALSSGLDVKLCIPAAGPRQKMSLAVHIQGNAREKKSQWYNSKLLSPLHL